MDKISFCISFFSRPLRRRKLECTAVWACWASGRSRTRNRTMFLGRSWGRTRLWVGHVTILLRLLLSGDVHETLQTLEMMVHSLFYSLVLILLAIFLTSCALKMMSTSTPAFASLDPSRVPYTLEVMVTIQTSQVQILLRVLLQAGP